MTAGEPALGLFEGFGIELECMIVDAASLDVRPLADCVLRDARGQVANEVESGDFAWSNELVRHVVEIKTNGPAPRLEGLAAGFRRELCRIEERLAPLGARLMPTGMHPWMDPASEMELWPHGDHEIYSTFHRIFDCRGHGWANLQSVHLNLPFADDAEFGRLHAAVRAVLPLLPALAASSPFVEGRHPGRLDCRLGFYATNARRVPSVAGQVVPEPVFSRAAYEALLGRIYADIAPLDPQGVLQHEWLNARGAIARFDRMALEVRVLDAQEHPGADLAIAAAASAAIRALADPAPAHQQRLRALDTAALAATLDATAKAADAAEVADAELLRALGLDASPRRAGRVWSELIERDLWPDAAAAEHRLALERILDQGCLARRILGRAGPEPSREALRALYAELCECLRQGRSFDGAD